MFPEIEPFEEKWDMTGACVAGVSLIKGIGRICGLDIIEVPGATGGLDTDMIAKAKAAIHQLESKDFVLMNIKAADIASHDGDPAKKVEVIETPGRKWLDSCARISQRMLWWHSWRIIAHR